MYRPPVRQARPGHRRVLRGRPRHNPSLHLHTSHVQTARRQIAEPAGVQQPRTRSQPDPIVTGRNQLVRTVEDVRQRGRRYLQRRSRRRRRRAGRQVDLAESLATGAYERAHAAEGEAGALLLELLLVLLH